LADAPDLFVEVWEEVEALYESNAGLEAKTVFEYLQRQNPGRFQDGQLRTLQRRVPLGAGCASNWCRFGHRLLAVRTQP
jgi:hypothetical protein